jgi:hypothetical protein
MIGTPRQGHDDAPGGDDGAAGTPVTRHGPGEDGGPHPSLAFEPGDEDGWHRLARGYRLAGLLLSAHRMGLLHAFVDGGTHQIDELAHHLLADPRLLVDICRALRATGLLTQTDAGWRISEAGARLAGDPVAALELDAMAEDYQRWGELDRHARSLWRDGRTEPGTHGDADVEHSEQAARRYARRLSNRRGCRRTA